MTKVVSKERGEGGIEGHRERGRACSSTEVSVVAGFIRKNRSGGLKNTSIIGEFERATNILLVLPLAAD